MSLAAAPVLADGCPEAPDISAEIDPLYEELLQAPDEMTARGITNRMWLLWDNAPDEPSQGKGSMIETFHDRRIWWVA